MSTYELLYIVPGALTDKHGQEVQESVAAVLEQAGAKAVAQKSLGKIKLAYPIKGVQHGTYVLAFFDASENTPEAIDEKLKLEDRVLRYTLLQADNGAKERAFEFVEYAAPLLDTGRRTGVPQPRVRPKRRVPSIAPPPPRQAEPAEKMSIEELDKKLDAILEDSDMSKDV